MTNYNVNIQDYLHHLVDEAVRNSIPETAKAAAELIRETPKNDLEKLLTPQEAADLLRCSIVTLWRWEKSGKVKSVAIGGKRLYRRGDLLSALTSKK